MQQDSSGPLEPNAGGYGYQPSPQPYGGGLQPGSGSSGGLGPVWAVGGAGIAVSFLFELATVLPSFDSLGIILALHDVAGAFRLIGAIALGVGFYSLVGKRSPQTAAALGGGMAVLGLLMAVGRTLLTVPPGPHQMWLAGVLGFVGGLLLTIGATMLVLGIWKPKS